MIEDREKVAELITELISEPEGEIARVLLMLVAINKSENIKKICDFHSDVLSSTADIVRDRIETLIRAKTSRSISFTRDEAIRAQGGT